MCKTALLPMLFVVTGCAVELAPDDTYLPPSIAIASPFGGATVTGVVTVVATATAADGAASVRFAFPDGTGQTDTAPPFTAAWNSTAVTDGSYAITATAIDGFGDTSTTSVAIVVANAGCSGATFSALGLPRVIPDDYPLGITSSLSVPYATRVNGLALSMQVTHSFPPDVEVSLISPAGTELLLGELPDLSTTTVIVDHLPIAAFDGELATGAWTLAVRDLDAGDVGTLDAWSLSIAGTCNP